MVPNVGQTRLRQNMPMTREKITACVLRPRTSVVISIRWFHVFDGVVNRGNG